MTHEEAQKIIEALVTLRESASDADASVTFSFGPASSVYATFPCVAQAQGNVHNRANRSKKRILLPRLKSNTLTLYR